MGHRNNAEFSKWAGILSAALSQHHLLGFEIAHDVVGLGTHFENLWETHQLC